tara:strand:+ start:12993 stop:13403 length:411 start_codon:yes stop_codon:yes gene_type:complete
MNFISKLFGGKTRSGGKDGLTQTEREAIVDLLLLCTYADNHLSLAEDRVLQEQVDGYSWESGTSIGLYVASATDRARKATDDEDRFDEYMTSVANRLEADTSSEKAVELMEKLFRSDGTVAAETVFADRVRTYLYG